MKKINSYFNIPTNNIGIRANANESYKNITDEELREITTSLEKINFNRYPDSNATELREAYGRVIGIEKENIIAGNGSDEMISLIINSQISMGDIVLTLEPDFSMYDFYTSINDGVIKKYRSEKDGSFNIEEFIKFGKEINPKIIIFSNPNNPTGYVISDDEIINILDSFENTLVIVDEAYVEFYGHSMISYINNHSNLIVTRTLSKAWGLAALRIGFLIANRSIIDNLNKSKAPYNLNAFSQVAACKVLNHPENILKNVDEIVHERERLYKELKDIQEKSNSKIIFYKSKANFIFGRSNSTRRIKSILDEKGISIRYFNDDSFRITVGSALENDLVVSTIKKVLLNNGG